MKLKQNISRKRNYRERMGTLEKQLCQSIHVPVSLFSSYLFD